MEESSGMLIRRGGSGDWIRPTETYEGESHLQEHLAASPGWLPGVSAEAWTVKELHTGAGPADICAIDRDGSITVVECKLASSTDGRRKIIGQVIDYASAIWHDGEDAFVQAWTKSGGQDLKGSLDETASAALRSNLDTGRISMCLAVDAIDNEVRRVIEYLNLITRPEVSVTAVQLSYARDGDVEILVPTAYGLELAEAKAPPSGRKEPWTIEAFLEAIVDDGDRAVARWLLERTQKHPIVGSNDPLWFGQRPRGSIILNPGVRTYGPAQLWVNSSGQLMLHGHWNQFPTVKSHPGFAQLASLLGQDHTGNAPAVPVAELDKHVLWTTLLATTDAVNGPAEPGV